jgi:TolB protein
VEGDPINFKNWRVIGSDNLVVGRVVAVGPDAYTVRFRLYDVFNGQQLEGRAIGTVNGKGLRNVAHQISDVIYEKLTGIPGAFATQIAYVTSRGIGRSQQYSLFVADSDGANEQVILRSQQPILSPSWSPDASWLAYSSLEKSGRQMVYIQEIATGKRMEVAAYPGLNGAPAWSPDGKKIALSLSKDGNNEIYVLDLASRNLTRLTKHLAIDTEPAWMPDGKSIVFTSDRSGKPQLYRVESGGGDARRLTFEGISNARASISPDGRYMAMIHQDQTGYKVAAMDLQSGSLSVLTDGRLDESPSFAPNSRFILYAKNGGARGGVLASVSIDGRVRQDFSSSDGDVREPAWSPFLH